MATFKEQARAWKEYKRAVEDYIEDCKEFAFAPVAWRPSGEEGPGSNPPTPPPPPPPINFVENP